MDKEQQYAYERIVREARYVPFVKTVGSNDGGFPYYTSKILSNRDS